MKLTFIFFMFALMNVYSSGYSQKVTLIGEQAPLEEFFSTIKQQTGYVFFYDVKLLKTARPVTLNAVNVELSEALKLLFNQQPLDYSIEHKTIVISEKHAGNQRISDRLQQNLADISGQVIDSNGESLPGVSVRVKGTTTGTTTDIQGNFKIDAPENGVLVFSYIGFESQEVPISGRTSLIITLKEDQQVLGEVVVTALGIEREEKSLTYAVQTIDTDKINEAKATNMIGALQGKVAGMRITMSPNGPGSSANVLLRGQRSLSGNNQPLYIIDGVPLDNSSRANAIGGSTGVYGGRDGGDAIGLVNSDDVESITVLKGASAAALYGSQGQNGAIIITTKRGKEGKVSVNYTGNASLDEANILPEFQYEYGQGAGGVYSASSENSWGPKATGQMITLWNGNSVPMVGQKGHIKDFLRTARTYNNTISVNGGGNLMQTYFSYGHTNAEGILPNQELRRHNFDLKMDNKISDRLSFSTKLTYIKENVDNKASTDSHIDVYSRILRAPVTIPLSEMQDYEYFDALGNRKQSFWTPGSVFNSNPYWAMNRHLFFEQKDRILGLVSAKYKFNDWLDLQLRGSMDKLIEGTDDRMYEDSYFWAGYGAVYGLRNLNSTAINVDALLSFKRNLTQKLELTGNLGASIQESKYETQEFNALGLIKKDFFFVQNAVNSNGSNTFGRTPQIQSVYGIATLAYNNYLYLDATVRNDWSSALTAGNQSYFYPSFGLSAIVSDMVKLPSWISYGKARLTFANSGYGGKQYLDRNYFTVSPGGIISPSQLRATDDYKPEITSSYELGLDWRFFNGRLGVDLTYYLSETKNQLIALPTPSVASLFSQEYVNAGLIRNNGIEMVLTGTPVRTENFSWDATLNFADNNNKVVRLNEGSTNRLVGGSLGDLYLRGWRKDDQGRRLVDDNGRPLFAVAEEYVGNINPDYMMGLSNSFSYKNLSLNFLIDYSHGGVVQALTQYVIDRAGNSKRTLEGRENGLVLDAYTIDGQKNTKSISAESYWSNVNGTGYDYSATNMRLREVVLGYNLPTGLLAKSGFISSAKLSLVGRNLYFFKIDAPVDPESAQNYAQPTTRNIGLNLKLSF